MSHGKIQLAPQSPLGNRVITISRPQHADVPSEGDDPLFINVLRRRWMLLAFCLLLSTAAGLLVISQFSLPKATSSGQLRYVELPPTLHGVYKPPEMVEFTEILKSNEIMSELANRTGQDVGVKILRRKFDLQASRFSNIIEVQLRWHDGKQAIDLVNELMRIACEKITANRKQTLAQYAIEIELQYEAVHQRVLTMRDGLLKLQKDHESQFSDDGGLVTSADQLISKIVRADEYLDDLTMQRLATDRQLATLRSDVEALRRNIKQELLKGCRQQIESRKQLYAPNSEKFRRLEAAERELAEFEASSESLDYLVWRAKLDAIGAGVLSAMDSATVAAVTAMERDTSLKESKIEQIEFDMLPMESKRSLWENRRELAERRLAEIMNAGDSSTAELEEAQAQVEEAQQTRARLLDQLQQIRRGQDTEFSEMTVLTPASWQTTETSEGKSKLFVFSFAGCFIVLVLPVFALEHFYPSGDPAAHAAKSLGIPQVSRGTFVTQRLKHDRSPLHAVNSEAMRLLALRIQQSVHGPSALVLFSGLNHEKSSIPMITYLAECLARREERVLIVDACDRPQDSHGRTANDDIVSAVLSTDSAVATSVVDQAAAGHVAPTSTGENRINGDDKLPVNVRQAQSAGVLGLADFLHRRDVAPEEMICATSIPGVDIIPCGTTGFPREGLASSSLTGLFDECRQRYTMILVAGPSTDHPSDLQMLSARADGILFTVPPNGRSAGKGEDVVRDLLDLGAPVIGIVS